MASNQERQPLLSRSRTSSTNTAQQNYNTHTPVEDSITGISDEVRARRKDDYSICVCLTLSGLCWAKKTGIYNRNAYRIILFSP